MADEFKEILNVMKEHPEITSSIEESQRDNFNRFVEAMENLSSVSSGIVAKRQEMIGNVVRNQSAYIPTKLYHYTGLQGLSGIMRYNTLWATDFRNLNDSSELVYGAGLLSEELDKLSAQYGGDTSVFLNKIASSYREHGDKLRDSFETYIISLSEESDMLGQWRAYADQAKGYCLEFDLRDSRLVSVLKDNFPWASDVLPVIYNQANQRELIRGGITSLITFLNNTDWPINKIVKAPEDVQGIIFGLAIHVFQPFIVAFKHPGFSEEKEWRLIISTHRDWTEHCRKAKSSTIGFYLECIFIQENKEKIWQRALLPITNIFLGPLAKDDEKRNLLKIVNENGYDGLINTTKSKIPLRQ